MPHPDEISRIPKSWEDDINTTLINLNFQRDAVKD